MLPSLPETGLSNEYVSKVCKQIIGKKFLGVFPCDRPPKIKNTHFSIIFNTGDSSTAGEHFVAICANDKTVFYFDPFGKQPQDANIKHFLTDVKKKRRLFHWYHPLQHKMSTFCGFFCIGYLLYKNKPRKHSFRHYFDQTKLRVNDQLIVDYILKLVE